MITFLLLLASAGLVRQAVATTCEEAALGEEQLPPTPPFPQPAGGLLYMLMLYGFAQRLQTPAPVPTPPWCDWSWGRGSPGWKPCSGFSPALSPCPGGGYYGFL